MVLSAPSVVGTDFQVTVAFDEPVNGLEAIDFIIRNGSVLELAGDDRSFLLTLSPVNLGEVIVELPADVATDAAGNANSASNQLLVAYQTSVPGSALRWVERDTNAWWELDLGLVRDVDHILVWNRTDCCPERLSSYFVLVSEDPFLSKDLNETLNHSGVDAYQYNQAPLPTQRVLVGRKARYVREQLTGVDYLSLAEVEVFGSLNGTLVNGVTYEYYEGNFTALPDFDSLSPTLTGTRTEFDLNARQRDDLFAFRFRGCLNVPFDGTSTFSTFSEDGSRVFINSDLIADNDGLHDATAGVSGSVKLKAGMHPIEVQYFNRLGPEELIVRWEGPGIVNQAIPTQRLTINETGVSPAFRHRGREVHADDNTDGDLLDLTAEYALGRDPNTAWMEDVGLNVEGANNGTRVNMWYDRPSRLDEISYTLKLSNDMKSWFPVFGQSTEADTSGW